MDVGTAPDPSQEVFRLNPYAADVNLASSYYAKYCMKTSEEMLERNKVKVSTAMVHQQ